MLFPQHEQVFIDQRVILSLIWTKIYLTNTKIGDLVSSVCTKTGKHDVQCFLAERQKFQFQHHKHTNLIHQNQLSSLNACISLV